HGHEGGEAQPDAVALQHGAVGFDVALALQALDAAQAGRGRQADALGELVVAQPAVGLQRGDDSRVDGVECRFWHFGAPDRRKSTESGAGAYPAAPNSQGLRSLLPTIVPR